LLQRVAVVMMMAAVVAFALQGIFVAASEAATGDTSHYYLGFVLDHDHDHSHVVAHQHMNGTTHQHAIDDDDDDDALAKHVKEPGWNMALVICVLPCLEAPVLSEIAGSKLTLGKPQRLPVANVRGLRRPPRPPSIV
jgi:hypothetical protein